MEYRYHTGNFFEEYYKTNNITKEDLNYSFNEINEEALNNFKDKLMSLKNNKFLIVGDYDCDGICSTAIIKRLLTYLNIEHNFYITNRIKEGYGLNNDIVNMAFKNNYDVIFTVDNGIIANEAIALASELNIKVLVLDHHEYQQLPNCYGVLHSNLLSKPFKKLSAGGLSYLLSTLFYEDEFNLVLGGLAIIADMVGVLGYNRYLIKETYRILNEGKINSLNLINGSNKYDERSLTFNVIPKINAVSRMNYNSNILVKYLLGDKEYCDNTYKSINEINEQRKELTDKLSKDSNMSLVLDDNIMIYVSSEYPEGLCGLIANRLMFLKEKAVIVLNETEGVLKGSGRSPDYFNIYEYLLNIKDNLLTFGGHGNACGLSLDKESLNSFIDYVKSTKVVIKPVYKDVYEINVDELDYDFCLKIEDLKPFGVDLKEPLFILKDLKYNDSILMANKYAKYFINNKLSAISFKNKDLNKEFKHIIGTIKKDDYHYKAISFIIEDFV